MATVADERQDVPARMRAGAAVGLRGNASVNGFLSRSRDRLLLSRRIARFTRAPSPPALIDVVQTLLRLGEIETAWNYARQGYALFRDEESVRELHRAAGRAHAEQTLATALEEIRTRPTAGSYLRAARCAVLLRDLPAAFHLLEECLRRFPTAAAAHAAYAELLEQRWQRDLTSTDGHAVIHHLRKAWRLDGSDAARPLRLAGFLARLGVADGALALVDEVLQIDPPNESAAGMRETLAAAAELAEARRAAGSGADGGSLDERIESRLLAAEEAGRLEGDSHDDVRVGREAQRLVAQLSSLRKVTHCEKAIVLEPGGLALDESGALGKSPLTELAASLAHTAHFTARRSELGPLQEIALETTGGSIVIRRAQRCAVALLLDQPEVVEMGRTALRELVEGRLVVAPQRSGTR